MTDRPLDITILTDRRSWVNGYVPGFAASLERAGHNVVLRHDPAELKAGDICFYLSVETLIPPEIRQKFIHNLVVHASDLPKGKGWSPMTWQILEGASRITLTLFEAADEVDSGIVYGKRTIELDGTELVDEWRALQAQATFVLGQEFIEGYPESARNGRIQEGEETFYPRRKAGDSRLDPNDTIAAQFDLLRVVDNERYPAFFEFRGKTYLLTISKREEQ